MFIVQADLSALIRQVTTCIYASIYVLGASFSIVYALKATTMKRTSSSCRCPSPLRSKSCYSDAAALIRTIMRAVEYIHGQGIVHRGEICFLARFPILLIQSLDLKPENLLFRTKAEDSDIMIADFGLSRIMAEDQLQLLTEICGTPGVCSFPSE